MEKILEDAFYLLSDVNNFGGDSYELRKKISKWLEYYLIFTEKYSTVEVVNEK